VYLPQGDWFEFESGERLQGGRWHTIEARPETIPLFVRGSGLLPLGRATMYTSAAGSLDLEVRVYGDGGQGCSLLEDDGLTLAVEHGDFNLLTLEWDAAGGKGKEQRQGAYRGTGYRIVDWIKMGA
jgi:alpha-D-xyloside xylohydrolase